MAAKRKSAKRERRPKSHGLWIAPDLERTIKGEGGRRGLSDPPYGYYLQLADLALKSWGSSVSPKEIPEAADSPSRCEQEIDDSHSPSQPKPRKRAAALQRSAQFRVAAPARPPKVELPKTQAPRPPKFAAPKPPKRQPTPKLSLPKPPKRRK